MNKKIIAVKSLLPIGAAAAACGAMLYATGQVLDYLFRDVDPKQQKQVDGPGEDEAAEAIETAETAVTEIPATGE